MFCIKLGMLVFIAYLDIINGETVYACEGMMMSPSCPADYVIKVSTARYGRFSNAVCPVDDDTQYTGIECFILQTEKVSEICDDRQFCQVVVSNSIFQDPCPAGVFKYMEITYQCLPTVSSTYVPAYSIDIVERTMPQQIVLLSRRKSYQPFLSNTKILQKAKHIENSFIFNMGTNKDSKN